MCYVVMTDKLYQPFLYLCYSVPSITKVWRGAGLLQGHTVLLAIVISSYMTTCPGFCTRGRRGGGGGGGGLPPKPMQIVSVYIANAIKGMHKVQCKRGISCLYKVTFKIQAGCHHKSCNTHMPICKHQAYPPKFKAR